MSLAITQIGSLPHHNVDAALAYSFEHDIPFLPQIPIRNPWEFMIPQAVDGMPGLMLDADGTATLDENVWTGRSRVFNDRLLKAFEESNEADAFVSFEPSAATSSSWQPFLWEIEERGTQSVKIQLAGPLTAQWSIKLDHGSAADSRPEIAAQIYRLVLARAIAMGRRIKACGAEPTLFLDEPALFSLNLAEPRHRFAFQELQLVISALKKEGITVGLHCCSNTDWDRVFLLGLDLVSMDTALSLESCLKSTASLRRYIEDGGRLALGLVPTQSKSSAPTFSADRLVDTLLSHFDSALEGNTRLKNQILSKSWLTPSCGLALHSVPATQEVLSYLRDCQNLLRKKLLSS